MDSSAEELSDWITAGFGACGIEAGGLEIAVRAGLGLRSLGFRRLGCRV